MSVVPQLNQWVNALGWTLIHFFWQGLCIAGLYWLIMRSTRPERAASRYWAGMTGLLVAVIAPVVTFIYYLPASGAAIVYGEASAGAISLSAVVNPSFTQLLRSAMEPALPAVVLLWAVGVVILSGRAFMGWLGARRLVSIGTSPVSAELQQTMQKLKHRIGVSQTVQVLRSIDVSVPTVIGWLKPVILLPASVLVRLPQAQLEMIIAHELGHIKRFDYLLNLLQLIVETIFFYHPAIRWMSNQIRQEREHCCDDLVVARCGKPAVYARALANLESLRNPVNAVAMTATGGDLVHRVRRIVRRELPRNHAGFTQMALLLSVTAMVSLSARHGIEISKQFKEEAPEAPIALVQHSGLALESKTLWVESLGKEVFQSSLSGLEDAVRPVAAPAGEPAGQQTVAVPDLQIAVQQPAQEFRPDQVAQQESIVTPAQRLPSTDQGANETVAPAPLANGRMLSRMMASTTLPEIETSDPAVRAREELQDMKREFKVVAENVVPPVYPFKARRKRLEGHVRLEFSVDSEGRARNIQVVEAAPAEIFENSAIRALEKWTFQVNEEHLESARVFQDFDFNMKDEGPLLSKRERRCDITGSRICGLSTYNK